MLQHRLLDDSQAPSSRRTFPPRLTAEDGDSHVIVEADKPDARITKILYFR